MWPLLSAFYWALIAVTCPIFFAGALALFLATALFDRRRVALHLYTCFWASFYVYANPLWRVRFTGRARLPWRGPAVLVANHSSLIDILVLFGLYRPFKWVSKREIFKVPFVGWNMRLNDYVGLVRGDPASIEKMMKASAAHLAAGAPIMIFPEGTRSKTGALQAFKSGAFRLALDAKCPLVPIAVRGTGAALPKHGLTLRQRMDATVEVLEPLDPAQYGSVEALRDAARDAIARALGEAVPQASRVA